MKKKIHELVHGYMIIVSTFNAAILTCVLRLFVFTGRFGTLLSMMVSLIIEIGIIVIIKNLLKMDENKLYKELDGRINEEL